MGRHLSLRLQKQLMLSSIAREASERRKLKESEQEVGYFCAIQCPPFFTSVTAGLLH